jgi:hypothetical protein
MNKIKNKKSLKSLPRKNKLLLQVRLVLYKKEIKKKKKILILNLRRMQIKEKMKKVRKVEITKGKKKVTEKKTVKTPLTRVE